MKQSKKMDLGCNLNLFFLTFKHIQTHDMTFQFNNNVQEYNEKHVYETKKVLHSQYLSEIRRYNTMTLAYNVLYCIVTIQKQISLV